MEKVKTEFTADGSGFTQVTRQIKSEVSDLKGELVNGLKGAIFTTFSVQALRSFGEEFKEFVNNIEVARKQTGANTTDLQVWDKQIQKVGGSMEDVTHLMNKLAIARDKALEDPTGKESKAFAGLGIDRGTLINTEAPEIFKKLQDRISGAGSAAGSLGNLMDLLGEKSVKSLSVFTDSFKTTEDKLRQAGKLIDSELIAKYKELDKIDKGLTIGDTIAGGPQGKAESVSAMKEAWISAKSGFQLLLGIPLAATTDALGLTTGANERVNKQIEDTQVNLALNGRTSTADDLINGGKSGVGDITPAQYEEIRLKTSALAETRIQAEKRIAAVVKENADKAMTDQEKLNDLIKQRETLAKRVDSLQNDKSKKSEFLDGVEEYFRMVPKIKDLQDKVDKENETKAKDRNKLTDNYMDKAKQGIFGNYQASDSLTSTGNFLGQSRSRLEDVTVQQTDILRSIDNNIKAFLQKNTNATDLNDIPPLF